MATTPPAAAPRPRGRPRSRRRDDAILDAAARLLDEVGYSGLTMEAVAAEAGVGKPTVYLRHPSKADLVAAVLTRARMDAAPALTGDLREDLVAQLRHLRRALDGVGIRLIGFCIAEQEHVPDLVEALRERDLRPGRQLVRDALTVARERGELARDADVETAIELLFGAFYGRHVAGDAFDDGWDERVVDAVLRAVSRPAAARIGRCATT